MNAHQHHANESSDMTPAPSQTGSLRRRALLAGAFAAFAVATLPASALAQVRMTVPPQAEQIALQGATIHTVTNGVIENGTIIFNAAIRNSPPSTGSTPASSSQSEPTSRSRPARVWST